MPDPGISARVQDFIARHIESVVQLEILLLLREGAGREFCPHQVAEELKIAPSWAGPHLRVLADRGMLARTEGKDPHYRYAPNTVELRSAIDELAQNYAERRVSVTALIFSRPPTPLREFSDAFRLRRDNDAG